MGWGSALTERRLNEGVNLSMPTHWDVWGGVFPLVKVDWKEEVNTPVTPNLLGSRAYVDYPIEEVLEYIDW
jgi:hypothetical protein